MKLKTWELALLFAVLAAFLLGSHVNAEAAELSGKLVRLHVVANSDSEADQAMKLQVRDAVLELLRPRLEGVSDAERAREVIAGSLGDIERASAEVVAKWGAGYAVTAAVCRESFPTTEYESFSLPAGEYTSLRVKIGRAAGHNWWCVVFPPICDTGELGPEAAAAMGLSEDEIGIITQENTGYIVKFKLLELLSQFFKLFG